MFASFLIVMTHNSTVNFKLIRFLLWIKQSHQTHNFETSKSSCEKFAKFFISFKEVPISFPTNFASIFSASCIIPLSLVSSKMIYFGQKQPIKVQIMRFLSVRVKIHQIHYVNFELAAQFHFEFCIIIHCHET